MKKRDVDVRRSRGSVCQEAIERTRERDEQCCGEQGGGEFVTSGGIQIMYALIYHTALV